MRGGRGGFRSGSRSSDWLALAFARARRRLCADSAVGARRARRAQGRRARLCVTISFPSARISSGGRSSLGSDDLRRLGWTLLGVAGPRRRHRPRSTSTPCRSAGGGRTASSTTSTATSATTTTAPACGTEPDGSVYGLPENFIYNVGGDKPFLRRLVSTFLSPLASGYLFVVALLLAVALAARTAVALSVLVGRRACCGRSRARRSSLSPAGLVVLAAIRRRAGRARRGRRRDRRSRSAGRTSSRRSGRPARSRKVDLDLSTGDRTRAGRRTSPRRVRASRRCTRTGWH